MAINTVSANSATSAAAPLTSAERLRLALANNVNQALAENQSRFGSTADSTDLQTQLNSSLSETLRQFGVPQETSDAIIERVNAILADSSSPDQVRGQLLQAVKRIASHHHPSSIADASNDTTTTANNSNTGGATTTGTGQAVDITA